ncbi:hypothetical protein Kpol_1023p48 [Vanderwaltozyma polyspora DSM 70294]|uniref:Brl1/Brr6 domain-containing protein n=1 Tax=Vanderwaltozyma polyspora (strain ATCC 22028 / DSM 70294 / BCRC 21397 / CBS 2163 / NBRC 10782 / NRRL Y-8283 / UCD 57-17) TaxID=436907 RepID=A7TFS1_VANPO|nr:uncharacterized protein Kpol_1023p48 [Vanderwaltozyma polyspora DSM 70294]EDO18879.1 hypothetical protein Kpol_1023p48 [Vanderwaltozyma polyspora DSM 70294]
MELFGNLSIADSDPIDEDVLRISKLSLNEPVPNDLVDDEILSDSMDVDQLSLQQNNIEQLGNDVESIQEPDEEIEETDEKENQIILKNLLSPTSLGVSIAQNDLKSQLNSHAGKLPINILINNNHHHHYHNNNSNDNLLDFNDQVLSIHDQHIANTQPNEVQELPFPWSSYSKPASRTAYALTSYLQLFLNLLTVTVIFSITTAFMKTLKKDITSIWNHTKEELNYESLNCQLNYYTNKCDNEKKLPALIVKCQNWEKCMNRNNDLFFTARSTLSAKLLGDIINSFIEPIGWKSLCFILTGMAIWCFSSNFLLGFARAKSYYGGNSNNDDNKKLKNSTDHNKLIKES